MRKLVIVLMLFIIPVSVRAQMLTLSEVVVHGGVSLPMQPELFSDFWKWGFNAGGGLVFRMSPHIALETTFDYNTFAFDDFGFRRALGIAEHEDYITNGGNSVITTIAASVSYLIFPDPNRISPYVSGGVGYMTLSKERARGFRVDAEGEIIDESIFPSERHSGIVVLLGGGIEIPSTSTRSFYFDVRYGIGMAGDENHQYVPVRFGLRQRF